MVTGVTMGLPASGWVEPQLRETDTASLRLNKLGRDLDCKARATAPWDCLGYCVLKWPGHGEKMTSLKLQCSYWEDSSLSPKQSLREK